MFITLLILACVIAVALAQNADEPWFCHGIDCPAFTQQNATASSALETRAYGKNLWTSTDVYGVSLEDAMDTGFGRLFAYISGANVGGVSVEMTAPVLTKVLPGAGPNCNTTFTVSFFVPFAFQTALGPPAPTDPLVYTSTIEPMNVAVAEFGGFAKDKEFIAKAALLTQQVEADPVQKEDPASTAEGSWYAVGYDPPFRLSNRHNEVWIKLAA